MQSMRRYLPFAIIVAGLGLFFALGGPKIASLDWLRANYTTLSHAVAAHFAAALALYMFAYVVATALSIPGATILSLAGGLLFGAATGTAAVVVAATVGATIVFLAARSAFGATLREKASGFVARFEQGFSRDAFSYLLVLRLIPLFPFFIVNIAPAMTRIRTATFAAATFIGIIPGAFAYVSAGAGLGAVFAAGGDVTLRGLLTRPEILTPIAALSLLALAPVIYRSLTKQQGAS